MDKAAIESKLPQLQQRHSDLMAEAFRVEGEFRALETLLKELGEQADKPEQDVNAPDQPEDQ